MTSELRIGLLTGLLALGACADWERGPERPIPDAGPEGGSAAAVEAGATVSFTAVQPLLNGGCMRCHAANQQAGNTRFILTGDATVDWGTTRALVDTANPAGSRLLAKTTGMGHGGGAIYKAGSPEYQALLGWITNGAGP